MKLNIKKAKMNERLLSRKHSKSVNDNAAQDHDEQEEVSAAPPKTVKKASPLQKKEKAPVKPAQPRQEDLDDDEEMGGFVDAFIVETDAFDGRAVYSVELPKMLFKTSSSDSRLVKEKSSIMVTLVSVPESIEDGLFKTLMLATKKNKITFNIKWIGLPEGDSLSVWKFVNPRISAIDLGTCAYEEREEPMQVLVEIEYDSINFDGVEV